MKSAVTHPIFFVFFWFVLSMNLVKAQIQVNGTVRDANSNDVIPYANVYLKGTHLGTVANASGEFGINVEGDDKILVFSSIGFLSKEIVIKELDFENGEINIYLENATYVLNPVVVPNADLILKEAIKRIPQNYSSDYMELTTFYRELIKKNNAFVDISQGVLKIYKAPYLVRERGDPKYEDQISVQKGHRLTNYTRNDTLAFKVMGGPTTMMRLDIIKNPGSILSEQSITLYEYNISGIQTIDGRRSYELSFKQKPEADVDELLYEGTIYIDEKSFAIAGITFTMPQESLGIAAENLIIQRPSLAILTHEKLYYEVRYRVAGGLWYLDYVRNEIEMKVNWRRKLFNSHFRAVTELVVTDKREGKPDLHAVEERAFSRHKNLFSDQIKGLEDTEYWEDFSIIRPEEDLKKAIKKISNN
ncbi:MAG: hypothetical protein ACJA08_001819 [Cyclobacteriaceae bacterium]|jgi:hypothetical protein